MATTTFEKFNTTSSGERFGFGGCDDDGKRAMMSYFSGDANGNPIYFDTSRNKTFYQQVSPRAVTVRDMRGTKDQFSLDRQGFELIHHPTAMTDFGDEEQIRTTYYQECVDLIKSRTQARWFLNLNHLIRRESFSRMEEHILHDGTEDQYLYPRPRAPARYVHVDQSYNGAEQLRSLMVNAIPNEEIKRILTESPRFQILTVWRPLKTIQRDPLAFADARSIPEEDLQPAQGKAEGLPNEMYFIKPPTVHEHEWWYARGMQPDEVYFFKTYDSCAGSGARRVAHSSFPDPEFEGQGLPPRESIEFRACVFE